MEQKDLSIIHGPPGTGKSTTLVEIIQQKRRIGDRVLVCCASHAAVDNLLARLKEKYGGEGLIRIGHPAKVQRSHIKFTLAAKSKKEEKKRG